MEEAKEREGKTSGRETQAACFLLSISISLIFLYKVKKVCNVIVVAVEILVVVI